MEEFYAAEGLRVSLTFQKGKKPMTGDIQRTQDTLGRVIGLGKDLVALFRDGALLLLAILLLALPEKLNAILVKAGFEEGSVVGFKWKSKLVNSDQALKDANATISDLQKKSGELSTALTEVAAKLNDPKLREKAAALQADNRSLAMAAKEVQATLASTIEANTPFVTSALSAGDVKNGRSYLEAMRALIRQGMRRKGMQPSMESGMQRYF